jgi:hypothetical protein
MADTKNPVYTVKHVDGVMHLTVHPDAEPNQVAASLRSQPRTKVDVAESK